MSDIGTNETSSEKQAALLEIYRKLHEADSYEFSPLAVDDLVEIFECISLESGLTSVAESRRVLHSRRDFGRLLQ